MSKWRNQRQREEAEVNFQEVLASKQDGLQLLLVKHLVDNVKAKTSKFTKLIIHPKYRHLLNDLIDIALTPTVYATAHSASIDRFITHNAIQILSNLSEEFMEEIFDCTVIDDEDSVIQTQKQYPILNQIWRILYTESPQETALAYLNKIVTPFIYQRPDSMLKILSTQVLSAIYQLFWNQSVSEIPIKALDAENQHQFFEKEKIFLIKNLCRLFEDEEKAEKIEQNIENLYYFIENLVEKHMDKYQKAKYSRLIKIIVEENNYFLFLITFLEKFASKIIKNKTLACIESYLKIHLSQKSESKSSEEDECPSPTLALNSEFCERLQQYLLSHQISEFVSDSRSQLLSYYKLVRTLLLVKPSLSEVLLTHGFLSTTVSLMQKEGNSNILHNVQREVITIGVKSSQAVCKIMQDDLGILQLLKSKISEKNSRDCFENQLFLIGEVIKEASQSSSIISDVWSNLSSKLDQKRKFYSAVIGGNPRGDEDRWDNQMDGEMILYSLNQKQGDGQKHIVEERIQIMIPEDQKIMINMAAGLEDLGGTEVLSEEEEDSFNMGGQQSKNKHYIDFQLPLDSDKEEDRSNSLEDFPNTLRADSNKEIPSNKAAQSLSKCSKVEESREFANIVNEAEQLNSEQTTKIILEDSMIQQIEPQAHKILNLRTQPHKEEISEILLSRYGLKLRPIVQAKQEIEMLLKSRYSLGLSERK